MFLKSKIGYRVSLVVLAVGCLAVASNGAQSDVPQKSDTPENSPSATVHQYASPDGETYFALSLKPAVSPSVERAVHDHIVLFDTSASQAGEHRRQALAVLESFLNALPADDRVQLLGVDVVFEQFTDEFASPSAIDDALNKLRQRAPLGATDLSGALSAALDLLEEGRSASVLYLGDGMSTANLVQSEEFRTLIGEFRQRQVPVHGYAVGPRTDLELLGALGLQTGGIVLFDRGDDRNDNATGIGEKLASASDVPIFYPTSLRLDPEIATLLPNHPLPLRSDRETIYLGRGSVDESWSVEVAGRWANAAEQTFQWTVTGDNFAQGTALLSHMWNQADRNDGLTVLLAGKPMLTEAQRQFDARLAQLAELGEQAVAARNLDEAEQIGLAISEIDPGNLQARTLLGAANQLKTRTVAQTEERPVDDDFPAEAEDDFSRQLEERAGPPRPEAEDLIRQEEIRREVRAAQIRDQVSQAVEHARLLAVEEPNSALAVLKQERDAVLASTDIDPAVRAQLSRRLEQAILEVAGRRELVEIRRIRLQERMAQQEAVQQMILDIQIEEETLERLIDRVRSLIAEGRTGVDEAYEEAKSVAYAAVNVRPGNGPAAAALFSSEAITQLNRSFRLRALRSDMFLETLHQVELAHVPFPDEPPILWPPAEVWRALTERRKKWADVDLKSTSPAEDQIWEALDDETELQFTGIPLRDVIEFLAGAHEINIIIDEAGLQEEALTADEPINLVLSGITLRSALNIMLEDLGLTYIIEDEVMKITTQVKAEERMSTRVYPVGDLAIPIIPAQMLQMMGGGGMMGGMGMGGGMMGGMGGMGMGGGMGGMGMGGGMGGMGMGGMGMGGMGMGGGMFSVAPPNVPQQQPQRKPQADPQPNRRPQPIDDPEVEQILDDILGQDQNNQTSSTHNTGGQAFAQVRDRLAQRPPARFDNQTIEARKKKPAKTR